MPPHGRAGRIARRVAETGRLRVRCRPMRAVRRRTPRYGTTPRLEGRRGSPLRAWRSGRQRRTPRDSANGHARKSRMRAIRPSARNGHAAIQTVIHVHVLISSFGILSMKARKILDRTPNPGPGLTDCDERRPVAVIRHLACTSRIGASLFVGVNLPYAPGWSPHGPHGFRTLGQCQLNIPVRLRLRVRHD